MDESEALCSHCSAVVDDDGVMCEVCQEWYHLENEEGYSGIDKKFKELLNR